MAAGRAARPRVAERLGILGQHLIRADHPPPPAAAAGGGSRGHGLASASASAAGLVAKAAALAGGVGLAYTLKRAYPAYQPVSRRDYSSVPASSAVDADWLTAALRASGALPPEAVVREAAVVPVKVKVDWAGAGTDDYGQVENGGGAFSVDPAVGAPGGPEFGDFRATFETGALTISFAQGHLSGFLRNDFQYQGVGGSDGQAVVVLNDDGTLFTP